ncbi:MAG: aminotransferase class V-fold PLP-dependent enzyme, partial [Rhodothermaceae bacterium]
MNGSVIENTVKQGISKRKFDVAEIRKDFPILSREVNGKPLVYLDNAATTQKPSIVIEAIKHYYTYENANIHRGVHYLSEVATELYENGRVKIKEYINAMSASEIVFVRGATEAINLLATTMQRANFFTKDDEIIVSQMEH